MPPPGPVIASPLFRGNRPAQAYGEQHAKLKEEYLRKRKEYRESLVLAGEEVDEEEEDEEEDAGEDEEDVLAVIGAAPAPDTLGLPPSMAVTAAGATRGRRPTGV